MSNQILGIVNSIVDFGEVFYSALHIAKIHYGIKLNLHFKKKSVIKRWSCYFQTCRGWVMPPRKFLKMKHLLFLFFALLPLLAFSQEKGTKLSDTFGECVTAGGRIPTKKSHCRFTAQTVFEPYAINDSLCYAVKIAVIPKNKLSASNGYPEGSLFLQPNAKLFYRKNAGVTESCDLDTSQLVVILPWKTSLKEILEDQEEYIANMGCSSQIFQATKASFEVSVVGISRKK